MVSNRLSLKENQLNWIYYRPFKIPINHANVQIVQNPKHLLSASYNSNTTVSVGYLQTQIIDKILIEVAKFRKLQKLAELMLNTVKQ